MSEKFPSLTIRNLVKKYDNTLAVNDISFEVKQGEIVALLGGNGAGKTTTIAMILGLLLPTSGSIDLFGKKQEAHLNQLLHQMNFSSPYLELPHRLTIRQNLNVYALLYNLKNVKARIDELAEDLQLKDLLDRNYGSLSAGQKTRAMLAKSLINTPQFLLLDEPSASLDPDTGDWIRTLLKNYQQKSGASILFASHNMGEVERLADNVLMMQQGKIVEQGSPKHLLQKYNAKDLEVMFLEISRKGARP